MYCPDVGCFHSLLSVSLRGELGPAADAARPAASKTRCSDSPGRAGALHGRHVCRQRARSTPKSIGERAAGGPPAMRRGVASLVARAVEPRAHPATTTTVLLLYVDYCMPYILNIVYATHATLSDSDIVVRPVPLQPEPSHVRFKTKKHNK